MFWECFYRTPPAYAKISRMDKSRTRKGKNNNPAVRGKRKKAPVVSKTERPEKSADLFFHLLQNSATPIFAIDKNHGIIVWNGACELMTGLDAGGMIGTDRQWSAFYESRRPTLADIAMDVSTERLEEFYPDKHSISGESLTAEGWYDDVGGKRRYMVFDAAPVRNSRGALIAAVETLRDVTEMKMLQEELDMHRNRLDELVLARTSELTAKVGELLNAEKELRESEARFREIFDESPIGILMYDAQGALVAANKSCLTMFGVTRMQDVAGFGLFDDTQFTVEQKDILRRGSPVRAEMTFDFTAIKKLGLYTTSKSGVMHLDVRVTPIAERGFGVRGYLVQVQDMTEARVLENQLLHAQKMEAVGTLAGGIAHDFNNILSAITNYGYLLHARLGAGDPLREYASKIMASCERGANLTQSLLAFSRKKPINPAPVDLNQIVQSVRKLLSRLIGEDIELRFDASPDPLIVMADAHQLEQVLMNLATNARDAMPRGGIMAIETAMQTHRKKPALSHGEGKPGAFALLRVIDTGTGIESSVMAGIFEPFFTTKAPGKGTGLGLSTVYGIIKQHGGFINVQSEAGRGSTFEIYLPLSTAAPTASTASDARPLPMGLGETVLLAEDDIEVRGVTKDILQEFGYKVIEAVDGDDAIEKYAASGVEIKLLILDMVMPRKSGGETFEAIRQMGYARKALFISGYNEEDVRERGLNGDSVSFISKPITPGELLRKVREALSGNQ